MRHDTQLPAQTLFSHSTVPSVARTRDGVLFDPRQDRWTYREGVQTVAIDFDAVPALSLDMKWSLKRVLLWYAENRSCSHLLNLYGRFHGFARYLASDSDERVIEDVTERDVLNYKTSLSESTAWYLGALSGLLKKWYQLRIPGISDGAFGLLSELRNKGNPHGVPVLTMDPITGPFSHIELEALQSALNDAFAAGKIEEDVYLLAWLYMALGQRPTQYAALKVCDVEKRTCTGGDVRYVIKVPRAKQRGRGSRELFKERPLVSQIGAPLYAYAQRVCESFADKLQDPDQAPLFPARSQLNRVDSPRGFEYHDTSMGLAQRLQRELNVLDIPSERTGEPLHITPVRFRRTLGTRAAQEGHGALIIAELLDHEDTQHVGVYIGFIPEIAARIDKAVAIQLAPLAQAFAGKLITNESEAARAGDPTSRIVDLRTDVAKPMGSCGQHSFCHFNAPIACYTCRSFEPWLDGPHEALLARLIAERDRMSAMTDQRIASINDRTILAVAEVVQLCRQAKQTGGPRNG